MKLPTLALTLTCLTASFAAEQKESYVLQSTIPELRLTNGTVFRNVTIMRFERQQVVLKSHAGTAPLSYSMLPEPIRKALLTAQDNALVSQAEQSKAKQIRAGIEWEQQQAARKASEDKAERTNAAIRSKKLLLGMTPEQAVQSWGRPERINSSGGQNGSTDQWIYARQEGVYYIYFRDGELSSWQHSERSAR